MSGVSSPTPEQQWIKFLESTPPNQRVKVTGLFKKLPAHTHMSPSQVMVSHFHAIDYPNITLHCEECGGPRVFSTALEHTAVKKIAYEFVHYQCKNCERQMRTFSLRVTRGPTEADELDADIIKLGEFPPFSAPLSRRVEKLLDDEHLELYRKGARAEAQALGVGAASYFRRIVENQWVRVVGEIRDAAKKLGETDLTVYEKALASKKFEASVDSLADKLPAKLMLPDGRNPLTLLHNALSVELHTLSDAECLELGTDIKRMLTVLLENIAEAMKEHADLRGSADRLGRLAKKQ